MRTDTLRGQKAPERPPASLVRDQAHGLIFESYEALHRWRVRHGLPQASCASIDVDDVVGERVLGPYAPAPEEIEA